MSFPTTLNPASPAGSDAANTAPAQFQALKQYLADVFGLVTAPTQQTAGATAISAGGVMTILQPGATVVADPATGLGIATKQYVDSASAGVYSVAAGSANAIAITLSPAPASLAAMQGRPIVIKISSTNTGPTTINANGFGAVPALANGAAMVGGELVAGQVYAFVYDGTNFLLFSVDGLWAPTVAPAIRVLHKDTVIITSPGFTVPSGSAGTVVTYTATMPSGGPWRAHIQFTVFMHSNGGPAVEVWLNDGTSNFASASLPSAAIGSSSGNTSIATAGLSLNTYTAGANVTFALKAQASGAGATLDVASSIAAINSHWLIGVMAST